MLRKTYNLTSLRVPAMECGRNEAIPKIGRLLRPIAQILAGARKDVSLFCVSPVIKESEKINKGVAIAEAGPEGELISFLRMDGVNAASAVIAQNKAYTSARDRKTTREMGKYMREKESPPAFWGDKGITGFGGGVPITQNGRVIGGIGVSGLSQDEDERIAQAAIDAVYNK